MLANTINDGSVEITAVEITPALDPFTLDGLPAAPRRPRLASYAGRTGRARRWLPADALRVLDIGCASGYGAAGIAVAEPSGRVVVGVERDPGHLAEGHKRYPWLRILEGDAMALELADGCADAILLLDVVEHLSEPARAIAEAHRVLRPGGVVIVSVPHRGALHRLDALNMYSALQRRNPHWPGLTSATQSGTGTHVHFTVNGLKELLYPYFVVDRVTRTGIGLAEILHFGSLMTRFRLEAPGAADALAWLYLFAYLMEDVFPTGRLGYHLTVRAVRS